MTTAVTELEEARLPGFEEIPDLWLEGMNQTGLGGVNQTDLRTRRVVMVVDPSTMYRHARFYQSSYDPNMILVDTTDLSESFMEAVTPEYERMVRQLQEGGRELVDTTDLSESFMEAVTPEYERVVRQLQEGGRELVAEEVYEMLLASKEPDGDPIQLFSLRAMADFLVQHRDVMDPIICPSPHGIMQLEWHILGDGLLIIAFVEEERVHCVVQADATEQAEAKDVSERMSRATLMERLGYLIPKQGL